jgi:hypothetical protein
MNVFERRNYPVISLLKYLSYYITKQINKYIYLLFFPSSPILNFEPVPVNVFPRLLLVVGLLREGQSAGRPRDRSSSAGRVKTVRAPCPDRSGAHHDFDRMGVSQEVKRPECEACHLLSSLRKSESIPLIVFKQ